MNTAMKQNVIRMACIAITLLVLLAGWSGSAQAEVNPWDGVVGIDLTSDLYASCKVVLADMNGDGCLDAVFGNGHPSGQPNRIYLNNGTAAPFAGVTGSNISDDSHLTLRLAVGDMDQDGDLDVITAGYYSTPYHRLYLNNGTADPFSGVAGIPVATEAGSAHGLALGDVDGDNDLDMVLGMYNPGGENWLYLNNGTASPFDGVAGQTIGTANYNTGELVLVDLNGDGRLDLIEGNGEAGSSRIFYNTGDAMPFTEAQSHQLSPSSGVGSISVGDVDRDGDPDIVLGEGTTGIELLLNNGTASPFEGVSAVTVSSTDEAYAVVLGDVDGDCDLDLIAGGTKPNRLFLNDGSGSPFSEAGAVNITADVGQAFSIALGDIDGDLDLDLVVANRENLINRYYLNQSGLPPCGLPEMVDVPAGMFSMGDPFGEGDADEVPVHDVTLSPYSIGKYEITNAQFAYVLNWALAQGYLFESDGSTPYSSGGDVYVNAGDNQRAFRVANAECQVEYSGGTFTSKMRDGYLMANHPVVNVTWYGAAAFCNWLSELEGITPCYNLATWDCTFVNDGYYIPTEAQWECAAAWDAGSSYHYRYGNGSDSISYSDCNYSINYSADCANPLGLTAVPYTSPVGWFDGINISPNGSVQTVDSPSPLGCYDMSGNAVEWCNDWGRRTYTSNPVTDPEGPASGTSRLIGGGAWCDGSSSSRPAFRDVRTPDNQLSFGFRLARGAFVPTEPDTVPPSIIAGPYVINISDTTAVVEWQTDELATSEVLWGLVDPPGTPAGVAGYRTEHAVLLTGLSAATPYFAQVSTYDELANGPTLSAVIPFTTLPTPDVDPPVILEGPIVESITQSSAVVVWATNEPADSAVYYGLTTGLGLSATDAGLVFLHRVELTGLDADSTYHLEVWSTDAASNGPAISPLISFVTLPVADMTPPVITSGPLAINVTDTQATIVWTTDEPATSGVSYNDGTVSGVVGDDALVVDHAVRLTGLTPDTVCFYTVASMDAHGNGPTLGPILSFRTLATGDIDPPVIIEGPRVKNVTHHSVVIDWRTDEPADSVIEYGLTPGLGMEKVHTALRTHHNLTIVDLDADTLYYFRVRSTDAASNTVVSDTYTFTTTTGGSCKKPCFTETPCVTWKGDKKATVYWQTDQPSHTEVVWGEGVEQIGAKSCAKMNTEHQMTLTNLEPGHQYWFRARSRNACGETLTSEYLGKTDLSLTTLITEDSDPPVITEGPAIVTLTDTMATVRWVTDEIADSRVAHGPDGAGLPLFAGDIEHVTEHLVTLTNLTASTDYELQVSSADPEGNGPTSSGVVPFTTLAAPDTTVPGFDPQPSISDIQHESAVVTWGTDEYGTSQALFGTDAGNLCYVASVDGLTDGHLVTLTGLDAETMYYYAVVTLDQSGNRAQSATGQFTTLTAGPDRDGDGVPDAVDAFPDNPLEWEDTDGDGLGDNFERLIIQTAQNDADPTNDWILTLADVAPNDDFDNDTRTNLQEFQYGSDPTMQDPPLPVATRFALGILMVLLVAGTSLLTWRRSRKRVAGG